MKRIVCEMCGSSNVVKQGEVYVCQDCGTQYDKDSARALMVEVPEEPVKTSKVTVDNSEEIQNLFTIARRSLSESNYENAEKYYEMLLVKVPNDWEPSFYSAYCQSMRGTIGHIARDANMLNTACVNAFNLILKHLPLEEQKAAVKKMSDSVYNAASCFYSNAYSHFERFRGKGSLNMVGQTREEYINRKFASLNLLFTLADNIHKIYNNDKDMVEFAVIIYKKGLEMNQKKGIGDYYANFKETYIEGIVEKVKATDPSFTYELKKGGCYIATCVYGSYDCPQVWTLRRYRDNTLGSTWYGRLFIRCYYAISPTVVKLFGKTKWFNRVWKNRLEKMVAKLNASGVENTPYDDIEWR